MLLAIDIGNTNTVFGLFDKDKLKHSFRLASLSTFTEDEVGLALLSFLSHRAGLPAKKIARVALCSVVPNLTVVFERMARKYCTREPLVISSKVTLPFSIKFSDPTAIGSDRLANAAAGFARIGKALVVVDIGTAVTFDIVSDTGDYLGGIIAPGPQTASANLAAKAARLFEVRIEKPDRVIGRSTAEALKSGLYYGAAGMIDSVLERIFEELGQKTACLATGGDAVSFVRESKYIRDLVPELTLEGIRIIADLNS